MGSVPERNVGRLRHTGIMSVAKTPWQNGEAHGRLSGTPGGPAFLDVVTSTVARLAPEGWIQVASLTPAPSAQRRTGYEDEAATRMINSGLALRTDTGMPFWDAVFLSGEAVAEGIAPSIATAALLHQPVDRSRTERLRIDDLLLGALRERAQSPALITALLSEIIRPDGRIVHLPMLDFSSKVRRPGAEASVTTVTRQLGIPGSIVRSGRSFHFYGSELLSPSDHHAFLCRALLLAPITDARWIAHQLLEGYSSLRISSNDQGAFPELVTTLEGPWNPTK